MKKVSPVFLFFYNFSIRFYRIGIALSALRNKKARQWISGRARLWDDIKNRLLQKEKRVWIHCASVGEFEQARPLIEKMKAEMPDYKIVLTFFSPSGYELRKNYEYADYVFYLPLDTIQNARQFIGLLDPSLVVFVKYEFWVNHLSVLHDKKIPVILIDAIFRKEQIFFKRIGKDFLSVLSWFKYILVQDEHSFSLLSQQGLSNIEMSNDTRFDRVQEIARNPKEFPHIKRFCSGNKILVCGSTWPADEHIMIRWINEELKGMNGWKVMIVPHEISKAHMDKLLCDIDPPVILYSESGEVDLKNWKVLIIDQVGMLSSLYKNATISYVGGGFGKGIHNILEAAVFGMPVIFGPRYKKFNEANELIKAGGAFAVASYGKFMLKFIELTDNEIYYRQTSAISEACVKNHGGASKQIIERIKEVLG